MRKILISALLFVTTSAFGQNDDDAFIYPQSKVSFDTLRDEILKVTGSIQREGIYDYVAEYRLFTKKFIFTKSHGKAQSLYKGEFFPITNDRLDTATKKLIVSGSNGGQMLHRSPFIQYSCSVIEYERQGKSRGQYGGSIALLRNQDDSISLLQNPGTVGWPEDVNQDVSLKWDTENKKLEVEYADTSGYYSKRKLVIELNKTLDCYLSVWSEDDEKFVEVAFYKGGKNRYPVLFND